MGQTHVFLRLDAPLEHNQAWGTIRKSDQTVVITVWEDRIHQIDEVQCGCITHHSKRNSQPPPTAGWIREYERRLEHVSLIRQGIPCYLVINNPKDPKKYTREVG